MNAKLKEKELDEKEYEEILNKIYGEVKLGSLVLMLVE